MAQSPESSRSTGAISSILPPETSEVFVAPTLNLPKHLENEDVDARQQAVDRNPVDTGSEIPDSNARIFANNQNENAASWKELFSQGLEQALDSEAAGPWHANFEPALQPYRDLLADTAAPAIHVTLKSKTADPWHVNFGPTVEPYGTSLATASAPATYISLDSEFADPWPVNVEPALEPYGTLLANALDPEANPARDSSAISLADYKETFLASQPMAPLEAAEKASIKPDEVVSKENQTTSLPSLDEVFETIDRVNYKVNTTLIPRTDKKNYGRSELWTLPLTFGRGRAGDCEDYALEKREALLQAGIPASSLFFAVGHAPATGRHAVLMIMTDQGDYVLDNMTSEIKPWFEAGYSWISRQSADDPLIWAHVNS